MKNLIALATDVMNLFGINSEVSSVRIFTNDAKESIVKITSKKSFEDEWDNVPIEKFLQDHPAIRISLEDAWTLRVLTPEWYSGITDFNLNPSAIDTKDLPGNVKSVQIIFNGLITLSDLKYYAIQAGFIDLEDSDFSISGNKIICRYNNERSVSIRFYDGKKVSVGVITIIDHR